MSGPAASPFQPPLRLGEIAALARYLVEFDPVLAEELADHLRARADEFDAAAGAGRLESKDRARRYRTLLGLIDHERSVPRSHGSP